MSDPSNVRDVAVFPVTPGRWVDVVDLFERKGPRGGTPIPGSCWCACWQEEQGRPTLRKAAFKAGIDAGRTPGLIAYLDGRVVGWVAVAPREDYSRLERSRQYGPNPGDGNVYAVTCFYVDRDARGAGVATALLDAAIAYARDAGAAALDAFPKLDIAPHATGNRRAQENYNWMGRLESYETRGFEPIRRSNKRAVMRLTL